ncbi:MAG: DNA mismatch repair endonuclease MutL [Paraprevotella sp.]|nr:DNA mismatch repair endonuclease MutL [Paraprevotella sp.]
MSDIIHLLPDSVANQIAAGEVIQRPASVIKELVENAVDAGAERIDVVVLDAGKTSIQVIDDGKGMSETDARLAFERHATSKIREAADLFALRTMGFRGEALASIAAVAEVELRTRQHDAELGTKVLLAASQVDSQEPDSCPAGSNFVVRNLFYNVPARRKFLKSNQTELNNILQEYERIVLVHPDVTFTLTHNGTQLTNLPRSTMRQRIANVFGKKLNEQLLPVEVDTTLVHLSGFVGKPEAARKKGAHQFFFTNGRYMKHSYFHKAVMEAFDQLLPPGEQIPYFLYLDIAPANIDVNIHPTKTEIKFENEPAIWQIIAAAVKEALGRFNAIPTIDFDTEGRPDIPLFNGGQTPIDAPVMEFNPQFNPFKSSSVAPKKTSVDWECLYGGLSKASYQAEDVPSLDEPEEDMPQLFREENMLAEKSAQHYQHKGRYILTSVKSGLMIVDQHRAHMRILYDRYKEQMQNRAGGAQGLLFPEILQVSVSESVVLDEIMDDFSSLGFEISSLGGGAYSINAIPAGTESLNPVELAHDMLRCVLEKGGGAEEEVQHRLALSLARSSAIVPGQVLNNEEMENLVDGLFACDIPNYAPDGKIITAILEQTEIETLFK